MRIRQNNSMIKEIFLEKAGYCSMKVNYYKQMESELDRITAAGKTPRLLLHSCCAPCSSAVLELLSKYFDITVFYYNPNIDPFDEYKRRVEEQQRFIAGLDNINPIRFVEGQYDTEAFERIAVGREQEKEGGMRCSLCYRLRLSISAEYAKAHDFDYFTTTLSVSPHKNAAVLNEIGQALMSEHEIAYLFSDFKKKEGYKRSIQLSNEYGLYRQDYCGCRYSKEI